MEVEPKGEIEKSQPFSAPFTIHNSGYLPFRIQRTYCYVDKIKVGKSNVSTSLIASNDEPRNEEIESGHNETVFCRFLYSTIGLKEDKTDKRDNHAYHDEHT